MRVVFDTNIFVSALAIPGGRADEALQRIIEGNDDLLVSKAIILELLDVLARKFARDSDELSRVAVFVADLGEQVEPKGRISILNDETDNRVLECAISGNAHLIVTGDKQMLNLGEHHGVRIVTLRDYLAKQ